MIDWNQYAEERKTLKYYQGVKEAILRYSPGDSILDVGCGATDVVGTGEFTQRLAINTDPIDGYAWPLTVGAWPDVELPLDKYSVVTCCQVLEHLSDEQLAEFTQRLKLVAKTLIISVPFLWKKGACKHHLQDPVDEAKLLGWMQIAPDRTTIYEDRSRKRLVAEYVLG